uniref:tRNA pseudouridine synthase n=1 Tax=Glossina morsitans morsitans TaxID=37546 RepID=A0A1B0FA01_GLOMM
MLSVGVQLFTSTCITCNLKIMYRYLIELSYMGTRFRGIQRNIIKSDKLYIDTTTVQGCLELALRVFRPVNEINTVLSSRTDSGVHALHTAIHVDLQRNDNTPYDVQTITGVLNRTLSKQNLPIRILNTRLVPETFHCRYNALGRTYLYRIAVAKPNLVISNDSKNKNFEAYLPVEELDRCFFVQDSSFDVQRFIEASHLLVGRHDFRTFMSSVREKNARASHPMFTVRNIDEINVKPGKTVAVGSNAELAESLYNYWDIEIKGKSFLYKQVRRMIGSLVAVATNRITVKCLYEMVTIPAKHNWNHRVLLSPAFGLYLSRVHYNVKDMEFLANNSETST